MPMPQRRKPVRANKVNKLLSKTIRILQQEIRYRKERKEIVFLIDGNSFVSDTTIQEQKLYAGVHEEDI